ncbi:MAG TPA: AI-2E family transporter, partial [Caldilineaceae bacterium]|nr:AI-2E family transporter [Caldilineaceae bacterium]
ISAAVLWMIGDYLGVIAFSLVMVIILKPVYDFFMRWLGNRAGLATVLTLIALFVMLIVPGWFVITLTTNQISGLVVDLSAGTGQFSVDEVTTRDNSYMAKVPFLENVELTAEQRAQLREGLRAALLWTARTLIGLGMSFPALVARIFVFFGIVGVLLPNYHGFVQRLKRLSPLDDEVDSLYLRKFKVTVWSMFIGIFVIAVIQGLVMGLFIWLGGVSYSSLWTLFAVVASMLPLGSSLVAIPIGVVQLVLGKPTSALIILAGYILIVSNIDSIIRPRLVSKEAYLNFALLMLSALGGYELFGFFGVVYGPVLMILFLTTVEVYEEYYAPGRKSSAASGQSPEGPTPTQPQPDLSTDLIGKDLEQQIVHPRGMEP